MADSFNISNNNSAPAGRSKALYQSEGVREVLELTDLASMFEHFDDVNSGVRSFL